MRKNVLLYVYKRFDVMCISVFNVMFKLRLVGLNIYFYDVFFLAIKRVQKGVYRNGVLFYFEIRLKCASSVTFMLLLNETDVFEASWQGVNCYLWSLSLICSLWYLFDLLKMEMVESIYTLSAIWFDLIWLQLQGFLARVIFRKSLE